MTEFFTNTPDTVPDCLVFKFEEYDAVKKELDTTVYVFYDKREHHYVIRGQRKWTPSHQSCTYSFNCDYAKDVADFLQYLVCKDNTVNEILYNYDNLPSESANITFEFMNEYDHRDYEISGYNRQKLGRKRLLKNLRMLRNIYNYYP
jgi:hypothetical protein